MIEVYEGTVTEIDDLGGDSWDVTTVTQVCDRCGIQKYDSELIEEEYTHLRVCSDCLDTPGPRAENTDRSVSTDRKSSESSTVAHE